MRRTDREAGTRPAATGVGIGLLAAVLALASALALPTPASAQGWDVPRLLGPYSPVDRAAMWVRPGSEEGGGDGFLLAWRPRSWSPRLSLRALGVFGGGDDRGGLGLDLRLPLAVDDVAVTWNTGLGFSISDATARINLPLQVAVSKSFSEGQIWLAPWAATGLSLDWRSSPPGNGDDFDVLGVVEAGLDLSLDTQRQVVFRLGWSLWERQAFALGLALPY